MATTTPRRRTEPGPLVIVVAGAVMATTHPVLLGPHADEAWAAMRRCRRERKADLDIMYAPPSEAQEALAIIVPALVSFLLETPDAPAYDCPAHDEECPFCDWDFAPLLAAIAADRATPIAILAASPWLWAHRPHRYGTSKAPAPPEVGLAGFQSARRSLRKAIKKFAPQAEITAIAEDDEVCTAAASHELLGASC